MAKACIGLASGLRSIQREPIQCARCRRVSRTKEEPHRKISFETERLSCPKKHGMEYDEHYIWA